jgi:hypothetical protein
MFRIDKGLIEFFINEYNEEKKIKRACLNLDLSECIYKAYTAAQLVEKHKTNKAFNDFKKWREDLMKEIFPNYDEIKLEQAKKEGKKTWNDLKKSKKGKRKVIF